MKFPVLSYRQGAVRLLNLPHAEPVAVEVIVDDCYRISSIPHGALVIDIGAFYGEFTFLAFSQGHDVWAFEPNPDNFEILMLNHVIAGSNNSVKIFNYGVGIKTEQRSFIKNDEHPAGSRFRLEDQGDIMIPRPQIKVESMASIIARAALLELPIFVKMDCEGMEKEIFKDSSWLPFVTAITMEWHNYDGDLYRDILMSHGFTVELEGGGPPPRPAWDKSIGRGLLHARRAS